MSRLPAFGIRQREFERRERQGLVPIWRRCTLADVRSALVICAAPRSGSSLLFSVLSRYPGFYCPAGETNPFYRLNGFHSDKSDAFLTGRSKNAARAAMSRDILADCTVAGASFDTRSFIDALMLRLPLQWPRELFTREAVEEAVSGARDACKGQFEPRKFYLEFLALLRTRYPHIDPYYYDIPAGMVAARFPGLTACSRPPCSDLLEEPPFILLDPRRRQVTAKDLARKTLLLKSSADSYRLGFLRGLLPSARIRIVHLVRNPAASVNGLYDGWLHRGFFSHDLGPCLRIKGYSERGAWARRWWKYDLPAGWRRYRAAGLQEVCAFQWYAANDAILRYTRGSGLAHCLVRYEDIAAGPAAMAREISRIARLCRMPGLKRHRPGKLPVVQATREPRAFRWRERMDVIMPVIVTPRMLRMAAALGYDPDDMGGWR